MTTAPVEFELTIKGEEVVSKALQTVARDMNSVDAAGKKVSDSGKSLTNSQKAISGATSQTAQAFSRFGSVLSQTSSVVGGFGGEVSGAVGKVSSIGGALLLASGPVGIFTAAMAGLAAVLSTVSDRLDGARESLRKLNEEQAKRQSTSANIAAFGSAQSEAALNARLAAGGPGDSREYSGYAETLRGRRDQIAVEIAQTATLLRTNRSELLDLFTDDLTIRNQDSIAQRRISQLTEEHERLEGEIVVAEGRASSAKKQEAIDADKAARTQAEILDNLKTHRDSSGAVAQAGNELERLMNEAIANAGYLRNLGNSLAPPDEPPKEARFGSEKEFTAALGLGVEGKGETEKDKQIREMKELGDAASQTGAQIGQVFGSAFTAALNGQRAFGKAVRDGFRDMLAGLAVSETVKSIATLAEAMAASSNPATAAAAGPLYASSAKHAAAAALAGAGAIAIGAAGSGGGTSGGGGRPSPSAGMRSGDSGGDRNITINMNAPVLTAGTYADVGRTVKQVLQDAENKYGA